MAQFSVKILPIAGSLLGENQQPAPFDERPPSLGLSEDQASIIREVFDVRG